MLSNILMVLVSASVGSVSGATSSGSKTSKTTSAPVSTHTISVGVDGYHFSPPVVNASVGDYIEYRFYPQNHSVARAAYGQPCTPYEYTAPGRVGFWSGWFPLQLVVTDPPWWRVKVNDSDPIFFYCAAPDACLDGMVGVINPNSTFSFDNQLSFLANTTLDFAPGENPFPAETAAPSSTSASQTSTTASSTSSTAPATTSSAPPAAASHKAGLGTGPIVGIAIGAVAVAILAGVVIYMCGRQKTIGEVMRRSQAPPSGHNSYQPTDPGISEANYPNMQKPRFSSLLSGGFSGAQHGPGTETESYRSASPPIDERTGMMHGIMNPGSFGPGNPSSPGSTSISSPYNTYEPQEADGQLRSYPPPSHPNPEANAGVGPHELAVPSRHPSNAATTALDPNSARPFSYTDSESGYVRHRDETMLNSLTR